MLQLIRLNNPHFRQGAIELLPACIGIFTWGLMTGVAMINSGMNYPQSLLMTFCVFAGSSQLAALPLLASHAPIWVILATAFCVNLRFVVFSAHLRNYLMSQTRWRRVMFGYFTADISYVQFIKTFPNPAPGRDFHIHMQIPEFTCLCPLTGQPDFATIYVDYVPRNWLIESKSYRLFLSSFRTFRTFHEEATVVIRERLVLALDPIYLRVAAFWYPGGSIPIDVFCQYGRLPANCWAPDLGIPAFRGR